MIRMRTVLVLLALGTPAFSADPYCPRYPDSVRTTTETALSLEREFETFSRVDRKSKVAGRLAESPNFIDRLIAKKLNAAGIAPAGPSTDAEFLRRVSLDLTGRIPAVDRAAAFLDDSAAGKRDKLIDELLESSAFADQLTWYFLNRFKVTRSHENISTTARNTFYQFVRSAMAADRPYNDFVRELLSAAGEVDIVPGTQFFARNQDTAGPIQDSWDDITDKITTNFLGYKTECVSCHDGRRHLEKINLHLSRRTRKQFWGMSAFLSRMSFVRLSDDPVGFRPRVIVVDRSVGQYSGSVPQTNPGNRPARVDAVTSPVFFSTGATPSSGSWRQELARMVTSDRQFALATANYLWAYFFGSGIVDPPDAWDLDRIDPNNPPGGDWPVQNVNPELLDALADCLVANDYRLKPLIRQIVTSQTYQQSSRYTGVWKPVYERYFARYEARRLTAEQMFDSMVTATHTEQPMSTTVGLLRYSNQLPDPTEPSTDSRVIDFMNQLGRGDWMTIDRTSTPAILGLLFQMNDPQNVNRSLGLSNSSVGVTNRVHQVDADYGDDTAAIRRMFLATLTRYPTDRELALLLQRRSGPRYQWLSDLQWALLNKLDFTFQN